MTRNMGSTSMDTFIMPSYKQYLEKSNMNTLSLNAFIDDLIGKIEKNPHEYLPESSELTDMIQKECETLVSKLPEDAQAPMKVVYQYVPSALSEGLMTEFFVEQMRLAKTLKQEN